MRIPRDPQARNALFRNMVRYCEASRSIRRGAFRERKQFYQTGAGDTAPPRYNKIMEHVLYSASYLYAQASVRFGVSLPASYGEDWSVEEDVSRREMQRLWRLSEAGAVFGSAVTWAHVMDSAVMKLTMDMNVPKPVLIPDPSDIGVLEEDRNDWRQEALTHWYVVSKDRFARMIAHLKPSLQAELLQRADETAVPGYSTNDEMLPATVNRLIIAASSPTMIGAADVLPASQRATPYVRYPLIRMAELWVWDDAIGDYRVVQMLMPSEDVIDDYENPLLPAQHAFFPLSLTVGGTPGYLWGDAPINALLRLQLWRSEKMEELNLRDNLEVDPPIFFENMSNTLDGEKAKAFRRPGGNLSSSIPNSKATPMVPPPLPDKFGFVDKIDGEFDRAGGLPSLMTGQTQAGVRSGDQALTQAMLGSGPTMERAMLVEGCLERLATAMFRLHRRVSKKPLRKPDGTQFLLSQIPPDSLVEVWGHSQSPLYAERITQKAIVAMEYQALTREDFLELLQLPETERLKRNARAMESAQAARGDKVLDMKTREVGSKVVKNEATALKDTVKALSGDKAGVG